MTNAQGTARIHSHNVTVAYENWRDRHTRLPHQWPPDQCFSSIVLGGVVDPLCPERAMVFADASSRSELKKLYNLIEMNGGDMRGVTMWRSCWLMFDKHGPTSKAGRGWTFQLFMPTDSFAAHLTERQDRSGAYMGQVLVRSEARSCLKVKAGLGGLKTRLAAIHRHRCVPQIATACAETLVGPQVQSLHGFEAYDDW